MPTHSGSSCTGGGGRSSSRRPMLSADRTRCGHHLMATRNYSRVRVTTATRGCSYFSNIRTIVVHVYTSAASAPLASGASAGRLRVGYGRLRVPSWSGAVLLGWRVRPRFVGRRRVAVAVGRRRDARCAARQNCGRSAGLCCVRPGHMEQPSRRTADFITVFSDVCEETQKSAASASEDFCLTGAI